MAFAIEKGDGSVGSGYGSGTSTDTSPVNYATPTDIPGSHQMAIYDAFNPLEADIQTIQLNRARSSLGREGFAPGRSLFTIRFKTYVFQGAGITALPRWYELLRVCGMRKIKLVGKDTPTAPTAQAASAGGSLAVGFYKYGISAVDEGSPDTAAEADHIWTMDEIGFAAGSPLGETEIVSGSGNYSVTVTFANPGAGKRTFIWRSRKTGTTGAGAPYYLAGEVEGVGAASGSQTFVDDGITDVGLGPEYPGGASPKTGADSDPPLGYMYLPQSDDFESGVLGVWLDGFYHIIKGVRGTFNLNASAGQPAEINWELRGLYSPSTANENPSFVSNPGIPPKYESALCKITPEDPNSSAGVFAGSDFNPVLKSLGFNMGTGVSERLDANANFSVIELGIVQQYDPRVSMSFEMDTAYNALTAMNAGKSHYVKSQIGSGSGKTFHIHVPKASYSAAPRYGDAGGYRTFDSEFTAVGDNDFVAFYVY